MSKLTIITALMAEAVPLIDGFSLQKISKVPGYHLYRKDAIDLLVCGMGAGRARNAVNTYIEDIQADKNRAWVNIGIAGTLAHQRGELIWANTVGGETINCPFERHPQTWMNVVSVESPCTEYRANTLFDMEAAACLQALQKNIVDFSAEESFFCAKVVSDNPEENIQKLDKSQVSNLVFQNTGALMDEIENITYSSK